MINETKWTPPPWMVATSCSWRRIISESGRPVCLPTVQRSDSHPDLEFPNGGPDGPDAHLIAAAPELYEALENLLSDYKDAMDGWADDALDHAEILEQQARAALAKARGEQ